MANRVVEDVAVLAIALGLSIVTASASAEVGFVDPLPPSVTFASEAKSAVTNDEPDSEIERFGLDAAPWLPRVIAEMHAARGASYEPQQIMLVEGEGRQLYLVVNWGRPFESWVEFHKVTELGQGRVWLTHVRTMNDYDYYSLMTPHGRLFAAEAPVVFVQESVGMSRCGIRYRMIQFRRNTVDITPDWAGDLALAEDLDRDGTAEVISLDERFRGELCGLRFGAIPRILRRIDGRFVDSCADFPAQYAGLRELFRDDADDATTKVGLVFAETRQALIMAQAGFVDSGIAYWHGMYATLSPDFFDVTAETDGWILRYGDSWAENPVPLLTVLDRARTASPGGCPASEALDEIDSEIVHR
jgi:hypothetical protein